MHKNDQFLKEAGRLKLNRIRYCPPSPGRYHHSLCSIKTRGFYRLFERCDPILKIANFSSVCDSNYRADCTVWRDTVPDPPWSKFLIRIQIQIRIGNWPKLLFFYKKMLDNKLKKYFRYGMQMSEITLCWP